MLECVINVSEGRHLDTVDRIARSAGRELLDVHTDPDHNRSVITVAGEAAARAVATGTVLVLDLRHHAGAHPRIGVLDVVPFIPLFEATMADAVEARNRMAEWLADTFELPCFLYGPERSLPDVRRGAFTTLAPDTGPAEPHPTAGACAVGARPPLVAYNVWLTDPDLELARSLARSLRSRSVRALGLAVGAEVQVSMNLVDPLITGPLDVVDTIAAHASVARCELVGLVPEAVLDTVPQARWTELDLSADRTIEARVRAAGLPLV